MIVKQDIAIIGLSPIEATGMRFLIIENENIHVSIFGNLDECYREIDKFDLFIVTPEVLVGKIDFFIPRRQKVLLFCHNKVKGDLTGFAAVSWDEDLAILQKAISSLISAQTVHNGKGELSSREIEVIRLVASGKINKEIADILCISINTVITHRKNISSKLGIKSASGLSIYAMMNGLI